MADWVKDHAWYHKIALPDGTVTPGWAPGYPDAYGLPERLDGCRVLDVGAWDGYWTFEALKRGAAEVVAIDNWSDPLNYLALSTGGRGGPRDWQTFDRCRDALGYGWRNCKRYRMDALDVTPDMPGGMFDYVFLFGVLYHCKYPLLLLEKLRRICSGVLLVESAICDTYSPYQDGGHGERMVMEFYPGDELGGMPTNWWAPTLKCLTHMVQAAGWGRARGWKIEEAPETPNYQRGWVEGQA